MFRALLYGSHKEPRELVWVFGVLIYLTLMGEAFFGYLLPWGQMSYWGAQVIVNLFGTVPFIGPDLSLWIRGDYVVSDATLNRFFALHVIAFPLVLLGLVTAHLLALHDVGSNNPDGVDIKKVKGPDGHYADGIPFHPYYTVKDLVGAVVFLALFCFVVFFVLGYLGTEPTTVWGQFPFDAFFLDTKDVATWVARLCSIVYFLFFFLMPWYTARDKVHPVPERVVWEH